MKLDPLSEWAWKLGPRRAENHLRAARNASVVKLLTSSRWTASVLKHAKTAMYALEVGIFPHCLLSRIVNGPAPA